MATWPFACPRSWSEQSKPNLIRSSLEEGFPKVRKRFTRAWEEIQVSWILPWTDRDALSDFFAIDCQDGATPFNIDNPLTGATLRVRWKEAPTIAASVDTKPTMTVTATLEVVF